MSASAEHHDDPDGHAGPARIPGPAASRWRVDPGSTGVRALAVVAAVLVLGTAAVVWRGAPTSTPVPPLPALDAPADDDLPVTGSRPMTTEPDASMVVSVLGAVVRPGLVTVPADARVADAVAAAGGRRSDADLFGLNWAQKLGDGDQVTVGAVDGSVPGVGVGGESGAAPPGNPAGSSAPSAGSGAVSPSGGSGALSLNTATEAELDALPGIGPVTASAIIAWRTENGAFTSVDQLSEVTGIGPARLDKLTDLVTP